jgi:hypothetical protein
MFGVGESDRTGLNSRDLRRLTGYAQPSPSALLEEHYGANLLGMMVAKGQTARLAYISEFIEQAKTSGLVQQAIERAGLPGFKIAPAKPD